MTAREDLRNAISAAVQCGEWHRSGPNEIDTAIDALLAEHAPAVKLRGDHVVIPSDYPEEPSIHVMRHQDGDFGIAVVTGDRWPGFAATVCSSGGRNLAAWEAVAALWRSASAASAQGDLRAVVTPGPLPPPPDRHRWAVFDCGRDGWRLEAMRIAPDDDPIPPPYVPPEDGGPDDPNAPCECGGKGWCGPCQARQVQAYAIIKASGTQSERGTDT